MGVRLLIELQNVTVSFQQGNNNLAAVNNVSLSIQEREIFGIVGASGAGKSTLLRTINLLQHPTSGKILIAGKYITSTYGEQLRAMRLKIGMIFQHFNLIRAKNVYDNVAFALKAAGKGKDEIAKRVPELLEIVGLSDKHKAYPSNLSGGQKQRVGIARALANNPQILLCDEPTSALDLETTQSILELLKNINRRYGITIVIITHEMDVVKAICDRVAVMSNGSVIEEGNVYEVFAYPKTEVTKQLLKHTLKIELPAAIFKENQGTFLKITYLGDTAINSIISDTAKKFNANVSILHGKIEYINEQPIGVLVVQITGNSEEVEKAVEYIKLNTAKMEVLYGQ